MSSGTSHQALAGAINSIVTPTALFDCVSEVSFRLSAANELFSQLTGLSLNVAKGNHLEALFPAPMAKPLQAACIRALKNQAAQHVKILVPDKDAIACWHGMVAPCDNGHSSQGSVMLTLVKDAQDKSDAVTPTLSESRFEAIVNDAYEGIVAIDEKQNILLANDAAKVIFGSEDLVGRSLSHLIPSAFRHKHAEYVQSFKHAEVASRPMHLRASVMGLKANDQQVPLEITIAKINVGGRVEMVAFIRDITEKNQLIDELNHISRTDSLTTLNNRRYLESLLAKEFERAKRYATPLSVLFIDVDNFKVFNDSYGHFVGDLVLKNVADTIKACLREFDVACRWGGEEFVILLPESPIDNASMLAERLREAVACSSFVYQGVTHTITISVGVAEMSDRHHCPDDMLHDADDAMLQAKKEGKNKVVAK